MATATETIGVPDIHCGHCKASIEGALAPLAGVSSAEVDIQGRTVTVTYDAAVTSRDDVVRVIEGQGYDVPAAQ